MELDNKQADHSIFYGAQRGKLYLPKHTNFIFILVCPTKIATNANAITLILCDSQGQQDLILHKCHLRLMRQQRCNTQNTECL